MASTRPRINIVRVYDLSPEDHGERILIDGLWPRGIKKQDLALDAWMKELAPSAELRRWFNHLPERWDEFRKRYFAELKDKAGLDDLLAKARKRPLLLIYAARDTEHNNAVALREFLLSRATSSK